MQDNSGDLLGSFGALSVRAVDRRLREELDTFRDIVEESREGCREWAVLCEARR